MAFAFALFSPDCVLSGTTRAALKFMADRGVLVLAHRWHHLSTEEVAQLYASNRRCRPASVLDDLVDELFSLSASLCCLVTSRERVSDEAFHRLLLDIKGPSDPFNCRPDQLRRALGATNKLLNLVHTSDTPTDSSREGAIFFPEIHTLVGQARGIVRETLGYDCPPQQVTLSGFRTVHEIKRRVLQSGAAGRGSEALHQLLELERQLLESQLDHVTLFPQLQKTLGQQARAVTIVESADVQAVMYQLISISARTTIAGNSRRSRPASLNHLLKLIGVQTSKWESLMINVEGATAPPRLRAAEG